MNEEKKQKQKQLFLWGDVIDHYLPKVWLFDFLIHI